MKLVFDTNVIVDVLAGRAPFAEASKKAMALVARDDISGSMTANTVTDMHYLLRKHILDGKALRMALLDLMDYLEVLDTNRDLCLRACRSAMSDFEDALLAESAKLWSADFIVTRNAADFDGSPVEAIAPKELLQRFSI